MAEPARISVSDAEINAALSRAREYAKYARRALKVSYSKATDSIRLILDDGVIYSMPRHLIQGLLGAREKELRRIQILGDGTGLLWPLLDVAHYVPGLLQGVYGSEKWMTALYKQRPKPKLVEKAGSAKRR